MVASQSHSVNVKAKAPVYHAGHRANTNTTVPTPLNSFSWTPPSFCLPPVKEELLLLTSASLNQGCGVTLFQ
ncbi:hypothetical protein AAFF_G00045900 [Aldrovandia affinis]|uniref:Uncharacterized protein n=1 Tax=Aldrovandia affinis TaxID=143900 RepID=A0AAD7WFT5_9TELE|nr:hypothetical protein AAFF_G00045900 [Aldrovandia affinis]